MSSGGLHQEPPRDQPGAEGPAHHAAQAASGLALYNNTTTYIDKYVLCYSYHDIVYYNIIYYTVI